MHASFNDRISYLCKMAALVVALVSLATIALGQELPQFVLMGLCLSVALLAIAMPAKTIISANDNRIDPTKDTHA